MSHADRGVSISVQRPVAFLRGPSVLSLPVNPSRSVTPQRQRPNRPSSEASLSCRGPSVLRRLSCILRSLSILVAPRVPSHKARPSWGDLSTSLRGPPSSAGLSVPQRPGCPLEAQPSSQRPIQSSEIRGRSVLRVQCVLQRPICPQTPLHPQKPCPQSPQSPELERPVCPADTCPSSEARPSRRGLSVIINLSRRGPSVLRGSAVKSGVPQKPVRPQKPVNPSWSVTLA